MHWWIQTHITFHACNVRWETDPKGEIESEDFRFRKELTFLSPIRWGTILKFLFFLLLSLAFCLPYRAVSVLLLVYFIVYFCLLVPLVGVHSVITRRYHLPSLNFEIWLTANLGPLSFTFLYFNISTFIFYISGIYSKTFANLQLLKPLR